MIHYTIVRFQEPSDSTAAPQSNFVLINDLFLFQDSARKEFQLFSKSTIEFLSRNREIIAYNKAIKGYRCDNFQTNWDQKIAARQICPT